MHEYIISFRDGAWWGFKTVVKCVTVATAIVVSIYLPLLYSTPIRVLRFPGSGYTHRVPSVWCSGYLQQI